MTSRTAPGNRDRLGSGTAMVGIVAGATSGLALAATILPIRVADDLSRADPARVVTAIEIAVIAGARVVARRQPELEPLTRQRAGAGRSSAVQPVETARMIPTGLTQARTAGRPAGVVPDAPTRRGPMSLAGTVACRANTGRTTSWPIQSAGFCVRSPTVPGAA
ncbi:MAG TPA: hypothetical protein VFG35_16625 [Actinoplanes sp.]|nr:hypothetical protein [Actinoplanes sp.]